MKKIFFLVTKVILILFIFLNGFLLTACTPPLANKLYIQGKAEYQLQNYHSAFTTLFIAAKFGSVQAQYTVGYMYYYGLGVNRDLVEALKWFKKAAYSGNVNAINALQSIEQNAPKPLMLGQ